MMINFIKILLTSLDGDFTSLGAFHDSILTKQDHFCPVLYIGSNSLKVEKSTAAQSPR